MLVLRLFKKFVKKVLLRIASFFSIFRIEMVLSPIFVLPGLLVLALLVLLLTLVLAPLLIICFCLRTLGVKAIKILI